MTRNGRNGRLGKEAETPWSQSDYDYMLNSLFPCQSEVEYKGMVVKVARHLGRAEGAVSTKFSEKYPKRISLKGIEAFGPDRKPRIAGPLTWAERMFIGRFTGKRIDDPRQHELPTVSWIAQVIGVSESDVLEERKGAYRNVKGFDLIPRRLE